MKFKMLLTVLALCLSSVANAAFLDGKTLNYQYFFPNITAPYSNSQNGNFVVGAGNEINGNMVDGHGFLDVSDNQITVLFANNVSFSSGTFNGFVLTDILSSIGDFTSVTLNAGTTLNGFNNSNFSFDANQIKVNWVSESFLAGQVLILDVNGVPEPASLALLGIGLVGIGAMRRRKSA